jgi:hypothetical protein
VRLIEVEGILYLLLLYLKQKYKQQKLQLLTHLDWSIIDDDTTNAITIMLNYEPTLPLHPPPPTTHYLAVSSLSSSSTNTVIVRHCRHRRHHWVGCCLLLSAACCHTNILTIVFHRRRNPTNDGIPAALPRPPPPPPAIPPPPSPSRPLRPPDRPWRRVSCVMDRHAALMPSLLVRHGKCHSRTRPPRQDTGPLRQRCRHSPAAGSKPSFASRAAAAGQATATAARRR